MRFIPIHHAAVPMKLPRLPAGQHYRFHTMVKPAGAQCNLDCSYCFYLHKQELLEQPKTPRMTASSTSDNTVDARFGKLGKQKCTDTGPLTKERMRDFDGSEVIPRAQSFMKKAKGDDKPFFV